MTRGDFIISDDANKIVTNESGTFILCGSSSDCALVADCYPEAPAKGVNCCGFFVTNGVVNWLSFDEDGLNITVCDYSEAAGSGQDHAITALDLGLSAKEAVKMAIKRNPSSGGKVRVFKANQ